MLWNSIGLLWRDQWYCFCCCFRCGAQWHLLTVDLSVCGAKWGLANSKAVWTNSFWLEYSNCLSFSAALILFWFQKWWRTSLISRWRRDMTLYIIRESQLWMINDVLHSFVGFIMFYLIFMFKSVLVHLKNISEAAQCQTEMSLTVLILIWIPNRAVYSFVCKSVLWTI